MPNNYFQFKQFTVYQDKCAMKVCTDACLFGAVVSSKAIDNIRDKTFRVLDIGTGTGLLALMFAQQNDTVIIDAVEIDEDAALQAKDNFTASPWKERLKLYNAPIQQLDAACHKPGYDLIISNPPFFENDLKSASKKRNIALHGEVLSLEELLNAVDNLLSPGGCFAVLLPYHRTEYFISLALQKQFYLSQQILVKQTPKHSYFRSILLFMRGERELFEKEIIIQDAEKKYTPEFVALLKDYYLNL